MWDNGRWFPRDVGVDDGSTVRGVGLSTEAVTCDDGICRTYVKACNGPCAESQRCFGCTSGPMTNYECSFPCKVPGDCSDVFRSNYAMSADGQKFCSAQAICNAP